MPKFRFEFFSQRNRPVADLVDTFILNGKRIGPVRDERDLKPASKRFTVDAPPDKYELQVEVDGFKLFRGELEIKHNAPAVIPVQLTHKCKVLPAFNELASGQQGLLATFRPGTTPDQIWQELNDNQAATFFQLSHSLLNTELANGRRVSSYIESVRRIGGAALEDDIIDGKTRTSVGWRLHATIRNADRKRIVNELTEEDVFGEQDGFTHSTHARFGLNKSHRLQGPLPKLQIVLSDDHVHADLDLDVEFDRSGPHDVYKHFIKRFPEVAAIYSF